MSGHLPFAVRELGGGRLQVMDVLETIVIILETICSIALIAVVLLQSGKEAGLSGALSGNADNYLAKSKKASLDHIMASATKWVAIVWLILTLSLSFF